MGDGYCIDWVLGCKLEDGFAGGSGESKAVHDVR